ncbi:MAG TPA: DUF4231 domain-containing protein [Terriglobia bacterium]|nr:DUF4231 domain-containing protein [Terriglobia bacterium]
MSEADPTLERLEDQINWYDRKSNQNHRVYKWLKIIEIVAAALVPLFAGLKMPAAVTGSLGVLIAALEGLLQLNQYHHNWIAYRSTCETLKHEKYLYLANAGPYSTATAAHALLAERVESLVSQEESKWAAGQEEAAKQKNA